jgi:hypothetical protein
VRCVAPPSRCGSPWVLGQGDGQVQPPVRRPLLELAKEAEELLALEAMTGCFGHVERSVAALSQAMLPASVDCAVGTESVVPDRIWISLLRLGLFEEPRRGP